MLQCPEKPGLSEARLMCCWIQGGGGGVSPPLLGIPLLLCRVSLSSAGDPLPRLASQTLPPGPKPSQGRGMSCGNTSIGGLADSDERRRAARERGLVVSTWNHGLLTCPLPTPCEQRPAPPLLTACDLVKGTRLGCSPDMPHGSRSKGSTPRQPLNGCHACAADVAATDPRCFPVLGKYGRSVLRTLISYGTSSRGRSEARVFM